MTRLFVVLLGVLISSSSLAVDRFNTYMWNAKNITKNGGQVDKQDWYEWWYFKVVIPETKKAYYFVYGVVNPWDVEHKLAGTRSYVGMGDFERNKVLENKFPVGEFTSSYKTPLAGVPGSFATDKHFAGLIKEGQDEYAWDIKIDHQWTFNAEGWMTGTGMTNIEWYPAQADAQCTGSITVNGEVLRFKEAPCYQDRNWGRSFPEWWTWIVSNHFEDHPETALAIGGGRPEVFGIPSYYEGVTIGLRHQGKTYELRPNEFDYVSVNINFGTWEVLGIDKYGKFKIVVKAHAPKSDFMDLQFMTPRGEIFHDYEALLGQVQVQLYTRKHLFDRWNLEANLYSEYAGIEFGSKDQHIEEQIFNQQTQLFSTF